MIIGDVFAVENTRVVRPASPNSTSGSETQVIHVDAAGEGLPRDGLTGFRHDDPALLVLCVRIPGTGRVGGVPPRRIDRVPFTVTPP